MISARNTAPITGLVARSFSSAPRRSTSTRHTLTHCQHCHVLHCPPPPLPTHIHTHTSVGVSTAAQRASTADSQCVTNGQAYSYPCVLELNAAAGTAFRCLSLPFTAFHCLSLPFAAFRCLSLPFTVLSPSFRCHSSPHFTVLSLPFFTVLSPSFHCPFTLSATVAAKLSVTVADLFGHVSVVASGPLLIHSVGFVLIRAADFSVKSAQAPRPYGQALIKTIWRGSDRVVPLVSRCRCLFSWRFFIPCDVRWRPTAGPITRHARSSSPTTCTSRPRPPRPTPSTHSPRGRCRRSVSAPSLSRSLAPSRPPPSLSAAHSLAFCGHLPALHREASWPSRSAARCQHRKERQCLSHGGSGNAVEAQGNGSVLASSPAAIYP